MYTYYETSFHWYWIRFLYIRYQLQPLNHLKSIRVIGGSISPMRIERVYLKNYAASNGTRTCIYDCVESDGLVDAATETYICTNTYASFLWRVATYIFLTPFCGRASSMKNCVAHHDKRKVKPYERSRHISLSYTRKRSKHRITLIERKTSSTSTITREREREREIHVLFLPIRFLPFLFSSFWMEYSLIEARFNYRRSIAVLRAVQSLDASHRMIRSITRWQIMRFIILMRQPVKQDLYDTQRWWIQGQPAQE